jgi:hypothetical protein
MAKLDRLVDTINAMGGEFGVAVKEHSPDLSNRWAKETSDKIHKGMELISSAINGASPSLIADLITGEIRRDHRYLQNELINALIGVISRYADTGWDGRNKVAVAQCRLIDELIKDEMLGAGKDRTPVAAE